MSFSFIDGSSKCIGEEACKHCALELYKVPLNSIAETANALTSLAGP